MGAVVSLPAGLWDGGNGGVRVQSLGLATAWCICSKI